MIKISIATEEDLDRILEIGREAISPPWSREALLGEICRDDSFFAVALGKFGIRNSEFGIGDAGEGGNSECGMRNAELQPDGGNINGFVILRSMGDVGELLLIAVEKAVRRSGIADVLMESALLYASMNFLESVFLEVRAGNAAAISLYEKHGFWNVRTRKDYYSDPVEDAIVMEREVIRQYEELF